MVIEEQVTEVKHRHNPLYADVSRRMKQAPAHIKKIATEEIAKSNLLHGDVTEMIYQRDDAKMIIKLTRRFGCSEDDVQLVIDYFILTRMMSSDDIGSGARKLL